MSGKRFGDGPVSTRTRTAGNIGAKRKEEAAASNRSGDASACPPNSMAEVPEVSLEDLQAARNAFYLKYICMPKKKSKKRRTLQDPLTSYQKRTLVDRYIAARKRDKDVDYKKLSTKSVFEAFIGHPEELKKHGDKLLQEFYQLYEEDQAQIDQLEAIAASPLAAAAEEQPSVGEEESQEEQADATPAPHSPEKTSLKVAVALQKVQMAEALLKEAQDTLSHAKD